jgi:hypothetical protein
VVGFLVVDADGSGLISPQTDRDFGTGDVLPFHFPLHIKTQRVFWLVEMGFGVARGLLVHGIAKHIRRFLILRS